MGLTHIEKSDQAPNHFVHETSEEVHQEDDLIKLMKNKDELYKNIKFLSESNAFDPVSK